MHGVAWLSDCQLVKSVVMLVQLGYPHAGGPVQSVRCAIARWRSTHSSQKLLDFCQAEESFFCPKKSFPLA